MANDLEVKIGADVAPLDKVTDSADRLGTELAKEAQIIDQVDKAAVKLAKDLERIDKLQRDGKISAEQHAAAQTAVRTAFVKQSAEIERAVASGERFVSTGSRMQGKLNLMRQGADVFTTAAMGMNPAMIAIQQGPQIIDAMLTSGIRVAPVMMGMAAAVGVAAGAVVALGAAWAKGESIAVGYDRAVTGVGRTAALTSAELKTLVDTNADLGEVSIDSARKQAEAYLATGQVGGKVLDDLIRMGKDYASFMGVDAADATKQLAAAMQDPLKAGEQMTRTFGLLTQAELDQIEAMMKAGNVMGAQTILLGALDKAIDGHADKVGEATNAWDALTRSISDAITKFGEWMYTTEGESLQKIINERAMIEQNRGTRGRPADWMDTRYQALGRRADAIIANRRSRANGNPQAAANQAAQIKEDNADPVRRGPSAETLAARARREAEERLRDQLAAIETARQAAEDNFAEQMRLQEEKLAALKEFYGEDSREYQGALQEKARMQRAHDQQVATAASTAISDRRDREIEALAAVTDAERAAIDAELTMLDQREAAGELNAVEALAARQELNRRLVELENERAEAEYQIAAKALEERLKLEDLTVRQKEDINRQKEDLEAQHQNRITVVVAQANAQRAVDDAAIARAVQDRWEGIVSPMASSMTSGFTQWAAGLTTWEQAWGSFGQSILGKIDQWAAEMVTKWLAAQAAEVAAMVAGESAKTALTAGGVAARTAIEAGGTAASVGMEGTKVSVAAISEAAKTGATVAGVSTRVATEAVGAVATEGISAASALVQIGHKAAVAAAGAYAALAGIPVIGPFLAPAAAVAALGAVLALGKTLFSAERGVGSVGADGDLYELHREEMVLPASIARPLRSAVAGAGPAAGLSAMAGVGGGGRGTGMTPTFNIYALDGASVRRTLRKHGGAIVESLRDQERSFNTGEAP